MTAEIIDIRLHGRGGQGVMTSSYLIAEAALEEDKYVHAFPTFGPERSGAPIAAFARVSKEQFYEKCEVTDPDIVVIQDPTLLGQVDVAKGLKKGGLMLINSDEPEADAIQNIRKARPDVMYGFVDASQIAEEEIGLSVTNTAILGAMIKMTEGNIITMDALETAIKSRFKAKGAVAEKNVKAIKRSFEEVTF